MKFFNLIPVIGLFSAVLCASSISTASGVGYCEEKLTDKSWPGDKYNYILKCDLQKVNLGDPYLGNVMCIGSALTNYSHYKSTKFQAYRAHTTDIGGLRDIVIADEDGATGEDEFLNLSESSVTFGTMNSSFESNHKWKNEISVDFNTLKANYNVYNYKGLFAGYELGISTSYACEREK